MSVSVTTWSVCFLKGEKFPATPHRRHRRLLLHDKFPACFFVEPPKLRTEEQETLAKLRELHSEVDLAYDLVQQCAQMLSTRTGEHLDAWLDQVANSKLASTPVFCRWNRERQRCREKWPHLVDQQWHGRRPCDRRPCDQTETDPQDRAMARLAFRCSRRAGAACPVAFSPTLSSSCPRGMGRTTSSW